jgi:hypothetical protein
LALMMALGVVGVAVSCGSPSSDGREADDYVGTESFGLSRCNGGTNGDGDYCSTSCTCTAGQGDCDSDAECSGGAVCCSSKGTQFGLPFNVDVCAPAHCRDKITNFDETQPDCGGSCGTHCPTNPCLSNPANGTAGHCTNACPCAADQGGCTTNAQCQSGLVCKLNSGAFFNMPSNLGVCIPSTCSDNSKDGNETAIDCGGSCLPCSGGSATIGAAGFGGAQNDPALAVAYDPSGNIYVAGRESSTSINFGSGALTNHGKSDIFLAKFDSGGHNLWSKLIGGTGADGDQNVAVATDPSGNVVLAGNFYATVNFGGGNVTSTGTSDAFVAKYSSTGTFTWAKHFGGTRGNLVNGVACDSSSNVIITGGFQDSITFGGPTFTAVSAGLGTEHDGFVAKLNSAGTYVWSKAFGSSGDDEGVGVFTDASNYVYLAGYFSGTINFGIGGAQTSAGGTDAVAVRYAPTNGAPAWVKRWGSTSDDRANAVGWGNNGNAVFGGRFMGTVNFGGGSVASKGSGDGFVVSLVASTGAYAWSHTVGGAGTDRLSGVTVRRSDSKVAITGSYFGAVNFGGGTRTNAGSDDIYMVYYNAAGTYQADSTFGGPASDQATAIASSAGTTGFTALAGQYASTSLKLGTPTLTNAGMLDGFLARFVF